MPSTYIHKDLRMLRSDRYTPAAANETRAFIEECLGERLSSGDLLEVLKDGVALCKLVNQAVPGTIRFKANAQMPFVQMENISLFLEACKNNPFNLQSHDIFLTIDLYESKDPAQVLQCLGAFSRALHRIDPVRFPNPIGARSRMSPQATSTLAFRSHSSQGRNSSSMSNASSNHSLDTKYTSTNSKTSDSSYGGDVNLKNLSGTPILAGINNSGKRVNEKTLSPPWNIVQYGYIGGASQGNLGVSFGGRRQITSVGPYVPNISERENRQRQKTLKIELSRVKSEEFKKQQQEQASIEEENSGTAEALRWAEETEKIRRQKTSNDKEENRIFQQRKVGMRQEDEHKTKPELRNRRSWANTHGLTQLRTRYSSKSLAEDFFDNRTENPESNRVKELERELQLAREREREYERNRSAKVLLQSGKNSGQDFAVRYITEHQMKPFVNESIVTSNKKILDYRQFEEHNISEKQKVVSNSTLDLYESYNSPIVGCESPKNLPRPLPEISSPFRILKQKTGSRPLPDPVKYATLSSKNYTSNNFPGTNHNLPWQSKTSAIYTTDINPSVGNSDSKLMDERQKRSQTPVKVGSWAAKSLLEREMEMERQRQQEWEESQRELKGKVPDVCDGVDGIGGGINGRWDVGQWAGYTGGDSQNKSMQGIGGGKRQVVGPRPPPISR
ncbi:putative calponin-like protein [Erysiphe neolycopersici]|uniref:Putative calponin-like protein n=1 Tax=Erysiphe neolycopersici TaxID=212602 RepID=A0A420I0X4_9PEZI|nr:putative calponin-like protein [Erysiphe neolycopersici]